MSRKALFLLGMLAFAGISSFASPSVEDWARQPRWYQLLQYETSFWGGVRSRVRSPSFFLAENGRLDPVSELQSTIEAMRQPVGSEASSHARCRFPARLRWLQKVGAVEVAQLPPLDCADFRKFSANGEIESISLVFATGYLSNPASYFGHPLIKFNSPREKVQTHLLDTSVNYGAITPPTENPVVYAFKGLFGGYNATFTNRQFYYNNHAYGELELRDMWEYRLNLTREEVDDTVAQIWEYLGQFFPYYFFSDNCATAVAQIIGERTGSSLQSSYQPYGLPYTLFDRLMQARRDDGSPLVASVTLLPSRQTRLVARVRALEPEQRNVVRDVAEAGRITERYRSLSSQDRGPVIEALFDYYSYRSSSEKDGAAFAETKRELLLDRLQLPPAKARPVEVPELRPPHEGQRPLLTRLSGFDSKTWGSGADFEFRTSYYDFLAPEFGLPANSSVRTLDTSLNFADSKIWVRRLELFGVETLNLSQTGLPGDGGRAWKFVMGFESQNLACNNCTIFKIEGALGQAYRLWPRQVLALMLDGRAQTKAQGSGALALAPRLSTWIEPLSSGFWKLGLSASYQDYVDDDTFGETLVRAESRWGLARTWDVRAYFEKNVDERGGLGLSLYW